MVALILDTDIGTDVDDAFALALTVRHPDIDLRAVTTVSGDTIRRAAIAATLLRLAGRDDVEVAAGIGGHEARAWLGHEGEGLTVDDPAPAATRDAVTLVVECTHEQPLTVATVGMQSNIARALDRDPTVAERIPLLAVMGGAFASIHYEGRTLPPSSDHNLVTDPDASVRALNAGLPTLYCRSTSRCAPSSGASTSHACARATNCAARWLHSSTCGHRSCTSGAFPKPS
ncbi:MAG: nucleoside hydrolase [Acidimicrobiia bacterium]